MIRMSCSFQLPRVSIILCALVKRIFKSLFVEEMLIERCLDGVVGEWPICPFAGWFYKPLEFILGIVSYTVTLSVDYMAFYPTVFTTEELGQILFRE